MSVGTTTAERAGRAGPSAATIAIATLGIVVTLAVIELGLGRPGICPCGSVRLWTGAVWSAENSQQLSDWYSPSHMIHGLIAYAIARLVLRGAAWSWALPIMALGEAAWELVENSPIIIERYRAATAAVGYSGDSVVNSVSDLAMMVTGFLIASWLPARASIALALGFELLTLATARDNLTLNVLMLAHPVPAIRAWQAGA